MLYYTERKALVTHPLKTVPNNPLSILQTGKKRLAKYIFLLEEKA